MEKDMPELTLLLFPVVILVVVRLVGFYSCEPIEKWPGSRGAGTGGPSGQTNGLLVAKASEAGPGVKRITSATFYYGEQNKDPLGPFPASKVTDWLWQREFQLLDSPQLQATVEVSFEDTDGKAQALGPKEFQKTLSGASPKWEFCVDYNPGKEGTGQSIYELIDCS
jgi:hypothetical protein